ncbi:unnamed protein product [Merluccius merluccius]
MLALLLKYKPHVSVLFSVSVDVEFCGYSITHPSESKINFRIQTRGGVPASEPLRAGLTQLNDVCQHVLNTFQARVDEFKGRQDQPME